MLLLTSQVYRSTDSAVIIGAGGVTPTESQIELLTSNDASAIMTSSIGAIVGSDDNYVGFSMSGDSDLAGVGTVFGWLRLSLDETFNNNWNMRIVEWAYNDCGDPIAIAGTTVIPEPTSFTLLGFAMIGIITRRRR